VSDEPDGRDGPDGQNGQAGQAGQDAAPPPGAPQVPQRRTVGRAGRQRLRVVGGDRRDPGGGLDDEEDDDLSRTILDLARRTDVLNPEQELQQIALAVRRGHDPGHPDVNWYLVRDLFVAGWTQERIAKECGLSLSWLKVKCSEGRWVERRETRRRAQAKQRHARVSAAEGRLLDAHTELRREIAQTGLESVLRLLQEARAGTIDQVAKAAEVLDRLLQAETGATPIAGSGGVSVTVNGGAPKTAGAFAPGSPQARMVEAWERLPGETDAQVMRRVAGLVREWHEEFGRLGLYDELQDDEETQRRRVLNARLGLPGQPEPEAQPERRPERSPA
jgi:hypothetical protein